MHTNWQLEFSMSNTKQVARKISIIVGECEMTINDYTINALDRVSRMLNQNLTWKQKIKHNTMMMMMMLLLLLLLMMMMIKRKNRKTSLLSVHERLQPLNQAGQ